jgi:signal transduction histidine kinase
VIEISVRDTGIGMNKNMIANLFNLNVNTKREGTEGEYSTGMGLILCKDFIKMNGGELWVESEEGKGTTFYFTVPSKLTN